MKDFLEILLAVILTIAIVLGVYLLIILLTGCFAWCVLAIISSIFELEVIPFGVICLVVGIITLIGTTLKIKVNTDKEDK